MKTVKTIDPKCCTELYVILNKLNLFYKLPEDLKKYILENRDKLYKYDFNSSLPLIYQIENQNTKKYMKNLYKKYLSLRFNKVNLRVKFIYNQFAID